MYASEQSALLEFKLFLHVITYIRLCSLALPDRLCGSLSFAHETGTATQLNQPYFPLVYFFFMLNQPYYHYI